MAATEGNSTQIDNEVLAFFTEIANVSGSIRLGPIVLSTWDDFRAVAMKPTDDEKSELKYGILHAVGVNDSRQTGPNKVVERVHEYQLILLQEYRDEATYSDVRRTLEDVMDKLAQNYRPVGVTALVSVSPGDATLDLDKLDSGHVIFRSTIRFTALEQIRYT